MDEDVEVQQRIRRDRLPEDLDETHMTHRMTVPVGVTGDTRLFVRVTQEDGHRDQQQSEQKWACRAALLNTPRGSEWRLQSGRTGDIHRPLVARGKH